MERDSAALTDYLQNLSRVKGYPGLSVCIRGPEGILYEHCFGYRSIRRNLPVEPDTVFGLASMSKSFTALSCCILAAEGKMSLDDPLVKYFPNLHIPGIPDELVTVRETAMHRAGIPPMEPLEWSIVRNTPGRKSEVDLRLAEDSPNNMSTIDQIVDYISRGRYPALGEPGEYMSYCNESYALLSYVVDQAAGIPLEQFLDERIFQPLGMTRSILDLDSSGIRRRIGDGNITSLFETDETGAFVEDDCWSILPPFRGCACIKTTARDVTKYYQMLSNGGVFEGKRILPAEAVEMLIGSQFPLRRKPFDCLGLRKRVIHGTMLCEHGGELHGVSTHGGFLAGGYSCAVLCNGSEMDMADAFWVLCNYVLGLPLETTHYWTSPCGASFSAEDMLLGTYVSHEGIISYAEVFRRDGRLMLTCYGKDYELRYCEQLVFAAFDPATGERGNTFRFFLRNGSAWAVKNGSRMYVRV